MHLTEYASWDAFVAERQPRPEQLFLFEEHGSASFYDADYPEDAMLVFGQETKGIPEAIWRAWPGRQFHLPMRADVIRSLSSGVVDGLVISPLRSNETLAEQMEHAPVPVVVIGRVAEGTTLDSVWADSAAGIGMAVDQLAMHFHDTYGQALANTYAGLQAGITTFDASAGGLGGCPYAESATGNLATEDLVWLLTGLGIEHGVDLGAVVATSSWMAGELGRPSPSAVVRALAGSES